MIWLDEMMITLKIIRLLSCSCVPSASGERIKQHTKNKLLSFVSLEDLHHALQKPDFLSNNRTKTTSFCLKGERGRGVDGEAPAHVDLEIIGFW